MPNTREMGVFRELILWVFDHHSKPTTANYPSSARRIWDHVAPRWSPFNGRPELEHNLPSNDKPNSDFDEAKRFLYLEPVTQGGVLLPVLSIACNFGRSLPEVRMRLALCLLNSSTKPPKVKACGYRFESPEGPGRHNYYHAQPITEFGPPSDQHHSTDDLLFCNGCKVWLPTSQPTFPLDSAGPVALALCILASLYGVPYVQQLQHQLGGTLKSELACRGWAKVPVPRYWQVEAPSGTQWYKSWATDQEFKVFAKSRVHRKSAVKSTTEDQYFARPSREQRVH